MSVDLNSVTAVGRLTKDCEQRSTKSGSDVLTFTLANGYRKGGEDETNYFDVVFFTKFADKMKGFLIKGKQIAVSGSLRQERWESHGEKKSRIVILANEVQLLSPMEKKESKEGSDGLSEVQQIFEEKDEDIPW